jgi:hypothetical protein
VSDAPPDPDHDRSLAQRALDVLVYAPAGLLLTAVEDMPQLAAKGRSRLELQLRNAHVLGGFAVARGRRDLERRLARRTATGGAEGTRAPAPVAEPTPAPAPATPAPTAAGVPADLAIPDYDTLSASQVVRRLDGLSPDELDAVYRHETATRGRRTILHRAQQLLGAEDVPGR